MEAVAVQASRPCSRRRTGGVEAHGYAVTGSPGTRVALLFHGVESVTRGAKPHSAATGPFPYAHPNCCKCQACGAARWYAEAGRNLLWDEGDEASRRGQPSVGGQQRRSQCLRQFDVECVDQPETVSATPGTGEK